ncbi:5-oxoprolinase subunit PxpA [Shewanella sedimentimangrovi]|uniref:5-oxoprolinase subunit PxpA n=1 Tax=Shewanella sedimentimangrovi TaxID=2814293 RepID=A0ABX7R0I6_9GAMM|nr:5-oxoprolinase subunit PxpA [Shewanella sedimentimangrovi]QSX37291.1 5-oxoprolinase subunit PxpA [Shewanella sedimentimangrovi]
MMLLNADVGEGYTLDADIIPLMDMVNIACGGHCGDDTSMTRTVALAKVAGARIGAHPSYPDPQHFGRQSMSLAPAALTRTIEQQILALLRVCEAQQVPMFHVKPHGALYNTAARDQQTGQCLIDAIKAVDPKLTLVALAGSPLLTQAKQQGLNTLAEVFADRAYLDDGSLMPRSDRGAVLTEEAGMLEQVKKLLGGQVTSHSGKAIPLQAHTLCLHGDNLKALDFARQIRALLPRPV